MLNAQERPGSLPPAGSNGSVTYQMNAAHTGAIQLKGLTPPLAVKWSVNMGAPVSYPLIAGGTVFVLAGPDLHFDGKPPAGWREPREPFLLESSVPGVFVAGDVRHGSIKRVASAVGEGSIAVQFAHQYLAGF